MELFSRFRRGTENRGFIRIKIFFAEAFQITSRFVLSNEKEKNNNNKKKHNGARCTLSEEVKFSLHFVVK